MVPLWAQTAEQLEAHGISVADTTYQGKGAVRIDALPTAANGQSYALLKGSRFQNGTTSLLNLQGLDDWIYARLKILEFFGWQASEKQRVRFITTYPRQILDHVGSTYCVIVDPA